MWCIALAITITGSVLPGDSAAVRVILLWDRADLAAHFAGYTALGYLPTLVETRRTCIALGAFAIGLGLVLEVVQTVVPNRSFEWIDFAVDAAGVLAGAAVGWYFHRRG